MTSDPIPHAPKSAGEVLRAVVDTLSFCPICDADRDRHNAPFDILHKPYCRLSAALANPALAPSSDEVAELRAENERLKADNLRFIRVNGDLRERLTDCEKRISYQRRVLAGNLSGRRAALSQHQKGEGHE